MTKGVDRRQSADYADYADRAYVEPFDYYLHTTLELSLVVRKYMRKFKGDTLLDKSDKTFH